MLSPLRYPGGKAKLYHFFAELVRLNSLYDYTYGEPYAGGAGLALKLLSHGFVSSIEINDIDPAIFAFWRSILTQTERFCEHVDKVELSVVEWIKQREIYSQGPASGEFELGFAAYYLNRTSRSGIIEGSGPIGGYRQESVWKIDARFNRKTQIEQIAEIGRFADQIAISNVDALEFCRKRIRKPKSFLYLDPPYYVKGRKLYKNFYRHDDHRQIAEFLRKESERAWILSYDFAEQIVGLYSDFEPLVYDLSYSAGPKSTGREVIFAGRMLNLPSVDCLPRAA